MNYIYCLRNKLNLKCYIGIAKNPVNRLKCHIICSNKNTFKKVAIHRAIEKYGIDNFDFNIIDSFNNDDLREEKESFYIKLFKSHVSFGIGYNETFGGEGAIGRIVSIETREKLSKMFKGKKASNETKSKMSLSQKKLNKKLTKEQKDNLSKINSGKVISNETREKIRRSSLGRKVSKATRLKMSIWQKGRKLSKERVEKMSGSNAPFYGKKHSNKTRKHLSSIRLGKYTGKSNPMYGKKHSDETKKILSDKNKIRFTGHLNPSAKKIKIKDQIYLTMKDAMKELSISYGKLRKMILNKEAIILK